MYVRPEIYKAMQDAPLDNVIFQDPLTDETRKVKKALIGISFIALLVTILKLKITGFLGLQTSVGDLGSELASGLAVAVVIYFLISFLFNAYIDFLAWNHKREVIFIQPYLEFLQMLEAHINVTGEQVSNAFFELRKLSSDTINSEAIKNCNGQLHSIQEHTSTIKSEIEPLIENWKNRILSEKRLTWRLRARFLSLWLLDILFPVVLSAVAIFKGHSGVIALCVLVVS